MADQVVDGRATRYRAGQASGEHEDTWCVEAPLEIRVGGEPLAVTMRTPGHDAELALGFALAEGIVADAGSVREIRCLSATAGGEAAGGAAASVDILLEAGAPKLAQERVRRGGLISSSCGVCGRDSVSDLLARCEPIDDASPLSPARVAALSEGLTARQPCFERTGGSHAAGIADGEGRYLVVREDVGRHNAVDKAVGHLAAQGRLPERGGVLVISGRASFEIVQKALAARLGAVSSISAPSSLAVEIARATGLLLVGFARGGDFNVYAGAERVVE